MATIWLIGMMGAGKTTVAPLVAARLGTEWIDTDRLVESRSGRGVADLFSEGEDVFRREEVAVVRSLLDQPVVVACGGGVVMDDDLVAAMRAAGFVVLLSAPPEVLLARTAATERPLLNPDPAGALTRILDERRARYEAAAHAVVSSIAAPEVVASEVIAAWTRSS